MKKATYIKKNYEKNRNRTPRIVTDGRRLKMKLLELSVEKVLLQQQDGSSSW
jgi:hypothetical protein